MHLDLPARFAGTLTPTSVEQVPAPTPVQRPHTAEAETDATLRLLRSCVEAMHLLQSRVDCAEEQASHLSRSAELKAEVLRAEVSALTTTLAAETRRAQESDERVARLEATLQEFRSVHADDVESARGEAANWRMRFETGSMMFDQLATRMGALETGIAAKLTQTEQVLDGTQEALQARDAENERLANEMRVVENASDKLRTHLRTLDTTIADQRARIACLQNKLATATYAMRFDHMSRSMGDSNGSRDILDLASQSLISAA